jgi:hypothetical protein
VVINGHDHLYERFAPQDPSGRLDAARGMRQFIVGTGGVPLTRSSFVHVNSEVRSSAWGVVAFTLAENGYIWEFLPTPGFSFTDRGTGECH